VQVIDNHLSTRYFPKVGYYKSVRVLSGVVHTGNVIDETGAPADDNI